MKKPPLLLTLGLAAIFMAAPMNLGASGSYTARPPQPGVADKSLDRAKYSLGQKIFNGKIKPAATVEAAPQAERLKQLQALLPEKTAAKNDLTAHAGKLTPEQLDALDYYVNRRYGK